MTALEATAEDAVLRFTVLRGGPPLVTPRAETATHLVAFGFARSVTEASRAATRDLVFEILRLRPDMSLNDVYGLSSIALDLKIAQLVNGAVTAQASMAKTIFADALPWFRPGGQWHPLT